MNSGSLYPPWFRWFIWLDLSHCSVTILFTLSLKSGNLLVPFFNQQYVLLLFFLPPVFNWLKIFGSHPVILLNLFPPRFELYLNVGRFSPSVLLNFVPFCFVSFEKRYYVPRPPLTDDTLFLCFGAGEGSIERVTSFLKSDDHFPSIERSRVPVTFEVTKTLYPHSPSLCVEKHPFLFLWEWLSYIHFYVTSYVMYIRCTYIHFYVICYIHFYVMSYIHFYVTSPLLIFIPTV